VRPKIVRPHNGGNGKRVFRSSAAARHGRAGTVLATEQLAQDSARDSNAGAQPALRLGKSAW
jgi:hypothetical protein